ncbi:zinc ribbon domain-containing protein [Dehalobacterium formicoaceticum]|uniref:Zinc ribbon domain-containing protein n=1 Tax=Dehalobacterium formicoaceticum TaxID=51515 RepID=A0ABT1Y168_9FIRM|nr:zinc ribbon domain-containing protein [Dehalobacterium formicoaceticum]MCR6544609.1 zinc ribbon domain-containing protein [Dehalobacterium formicoaceticum]
MSFLKKLSETVMDTATSIGNKSADLVEIGKLKLQKNQLEGDITDKKAAIGELVYFAHKQSVPPSEEDLAKVFAEIAELENQILVIEEKLREDKLHKEDESPAETGGDTGEATITCPACGQKSASGAKFCNNCGQAL